MNIRSNIGLLLLSGLLFFSGCRHEVPEPPKPSNTDLLCGKNWRITAARVNPPVLGMSDIYHMMFQACQQDNIYRFFSNGVLRMSEGPLVCIPGMDDVQQGNWSWTQNENKMNITLPGLPPVLANVLRNDGSIFQAGYAVADTLFGTGSSFMVILTFTKQ